MDDDVMDTSESMHSPKNEEAVSQSMDTSDTIKSKDQEIVTLSQNEVTQTKENGTENSMDAEADFLQNEDEESNNNKDIDTDNLEENADPEVSNDKSTLNDAVSSDSQSSPKTLSTDNTTEKDTEDGDTSANEMDPISGTPSQLENEQSSDSVPKDAETDDAVQKDTNDEKTNDSIEKDVDDVEKTTEPADDEKTSDSTSKQDDDENTSDSISKKDDEKTSESTSKQADDEKTLDSTGAENEVSKTVEEEGTNNEKGEDKSSDVENQKVEQLSENSQDLEDGKSGEGPVKIKLRSFASLCDGKDKTSSDKVNSAVRTEISGVTVGDIVQHGSIVESDETGEMHLKISNVVGGVDCITGLTTDDDNDNLPTLQISSITSLIEPLSPEDKTDQTSKGSNEGSGLRIASVGSLTQSSSVALANKENEANRKEQTIVNILKSPLFVSNSCYICEKKKVCEFRFIAKTGSKSKVSYICSSSCKECAITKLPEDHTLEKPRIVFEKLCGMCGKDISTVPKEEVISWQTREFCNKLCLADHIGEVARLCFYCMQPVRVLFMVKYCVRFGSDVHQFCSNGCLEKYKININVCCYCQKNLGNIQKVVSPVNKDYCSLKCLKRAQKKDIGQFNYNDKQDCTVCNKNLVCKFEFNNNNQTVWLCSDPCLNVFKYVNQVKSVNCCLCHRLLNSEDFPTYFFNGHQLRVFCSDSCLSVFIISARKIVTCNYCKVKKYNFDMIHQNPETYYCSVCCLNFVEQKFKVEKQPLPIAPKEQSTTSESSSGGRDAEPLSESMGVAVTTSSVAAPTTPAATTPAPPVAPILKQCNMCTKIEPAQFHMVMSDSTLRSFCSFVCATTYKNTFGFHVSGNAQLDGKGVRGPAADASAKKDSKSGTTNSSTGTVASTQSLLNLLKRFEPPAVANKSISCQPRTNTKGIQCRPLHWDKEVQTEKTSPPLLPVPLPVYVPTPMMMYNAPTPVPLLIPVPIPVPVFIPTTEKTSKDIHHRIEEILEKMPAEPEEAELILLASQAEANAKLDGPPCSPSDLADLPDLPLEPAVSIACSEESDEAELEVLVSLDEKIPKLFPDLDSRGQKRKYPFNNESDVYYKRARYNGDEEADIPEEEHLNMQYGLLSWKQWVKRRDAEGVPNAFYPQDDILDLNSDSLCHSLILFLKDIKRPGGYNYEMDTIFYLLLGLQKYLFENGSAHCIFLEKNFDNFTTYFDELVRKNWKSFLHSEIITCESLSGTRITEEMLWEARQLGAHTPHVLLNTLFYFNTKIFKLKSAEAHANLSFSQISKKWKRSSLGNDCSYTQTTVLEYHRKDSAGRDTSVEMAGNWDNPLRCPVKLYEFYLSKCPESVRIRPNTYYVYPEHSCLPDSPVWFSMMTLEMHMLEKMLNRILLVKEVQEALAE